MNFDGTTTSSGVKLKKGGAEYVAGFDFCGDDAYGGIDDHGFFAIYGNWVNVYHTQNNGDDDYSNQEDAMGEFLEGLRAFIPKNDELVIHQTGRTGYRHPQSAQCIRVTHEKVTYWSFPC